MKICPKCDKVNSHPKQKNCMACGAPLPKEETNPWTKGNDEQIIGRTARDGSKPGDVKKIEIGKEEP